ncbi:uncharacterized protein LOC108098309 [Drosophila ficusphila]|uniref:uncharacterized protein LOC108098309 n=1 Tax=Drosophila ficusphila TaxID=30025 RepID=UPI0007E5C3A4|nr:uncharacterized protein LOC108098309 [Drosophila ficusphila]XP_017056610.1 uncharacterized protein LOC108098309 [Drosophila ficusphila]
MSFTLLRKHATQMGIFKTRSTLGRSYIPMAGPPRFPMTTVQRLIFGCGPLVLMMIIPYWCLFNIPRWSRMHNGLPPLEEEEEQEKEPPPAKEEKPKKEEKKK